MFADTAKVSLKAGKGGDGAVSFRHEIYVPKGGPDGGDGGRGGNIIFRADKDTNTLVDFRFAPILTAENGKNGAGQRAAGRSGKDLIVEVPIGTVVYKIENGKPNAAAISQNDDFGKNVKQNTDIISQNSDFSQNEKSGTTENTQNSATSEPVRTRILLADLTHDRQEAIIAHGGAGGFGNAHFKSSTRQTPMVAEVGEPGEEFEAELELKSMADIGLVGLPNAGKSTFLSVVSNAKPEIADYPFTTITPNLGVATIDGHDLLLADIPGLIAGAAEGKGLGHDFLRHVDRTAVLLHLVDVYNNDAGAAYQTIRDELAEYRDLATRPEIITLTKCEGVDPEIIKMQKNSILAHSPDAKIFTISSTAHQGLTELLRKLKDVVEKNHQGLTNSSSEDGAVSDISRHLSGQLPAAREAHEVPGRAREARRSRHGPERSGGIRSREPHRPGKVLGGNAIPTISLPSSAYSNTWQVEKLPSGTFLVTGEKIEKFARRTDLTNYASVNRLRDILKKLGIRAELTNQGAEPTSIISIAGKEFTLVEQ